MLKKTDTEEMLMRVFRVAELLTSAESTHQEMQVPRKHPFHQVEKSDNIPQENTKH